jgi:phosphoribosyl-dephospho-CoA transferase
MFQREAAYTRTHDLLEIAPERVLSLQAFAPAWAAEVLQRVPFLVVRRGQASGQTVPVGVRGTERNQRWAAECNPALVKASQHPRNF